MLSASMFVCLSPHCFSTYRCCIMCITCLSPPPTSYFSSHIKMMTAPGWSRHGSGPRKHHHASSIWHFGKAHGRWKRDTSSLIYTVHTYVHPRAAYITCPWAHTPVLTHAELLADFLGEAVTIQTKQAGLRLESSWGIWRESCRWQVWKKS